MNCNDIRRVLDDHGLAGLSRSARTQFDTHLADCAACFDAVGVHEVLAGERVPDPRAGLLESIVGRLNADDGMEAARPARRWIPATGLAASLLLAVSLVWLGQRPEGDLAETAVSSERINLDTPAELLGAGFVEGEDYVSMPLGAPAGSLRERVSAWIFFMWSCLHCYELEAILPEWIAERSEAGVDVIRVPVQWNAVAELHARAFYAARLLGVEDAINSAFFREIHVSGNLPETRDEIETVFRDTGIASETFATVFDSSEVDANLETASRLADRYAVDATPTVVVNGAYKTNAGMAGSQERMLQIADWLLRADPAAARRFCDLDRTSCR